MQTTAIGHEPASHFVRCANDWREHLRLSHTEFVKHVGRAGAIGLNPAQSEWGSLRAGRRRLPSESFARLVLAKAKATDPVWSQLLEDAYTQDALARVK